MMRRHTEGGGRRQEKGKSAPRGSRLWNPLLFRSDERHRRSGVVERAGAAFVEALRNVVEGIAAGVFGGGPHDIRGGEQVQPFTQWRALAPPAGSKRFQRLVHPSPFMKSV